MSLWRFDIFPKPGNPDPQGRQIHERLKQFGLNSVGGVRSTRLFLINFGSGSLSANGRATVERVARELLADPVVEDFVATSQGKDPPQPSDGIAAEIFFKPGVMDNVAQSTALALADMGIDVADVRTGRRYDLFPIPSDLDRSRLPRLLGNECIEDVFIGTRPIVPAAKPPLYEFKLRAVPLLKLTQGELEKLSREAHLFLSAAEFLAIQEHFKKLGREPTDLELETLAQTWSEHCVHKTLKANIRYCGLPMPGKEAAGGEIEIVYQNLLRDTIARATKELMAEGRGPECLSVFVDNAGVIAFDDEYGVAFKVETHNHPSALEPYGGAATGIGGCIRDVLGCGLGAKPIANTDVFCVAPPDWPVDRCPTSVIHPRTVLQGITAGVRDYGNRMGIPTVNGAVHFDPRYLGNPLVYCGCVGLIPRDRLEKAANPGDAIVLLGGRTGRDGIHGATFSSAELTDTHQDEFSHAVQIGNAIEEKKVLDIVLQARDYDDAARTLSAASTPQSRLRSRCLFSAITDCGAGGLSSAIGEMAAEIGAEVHLDRVPLKYEGLRYDEIWISEAQERMVMAVPPKDVDTLLQLANSEGVEATVIGQFTDTRRLVVKYQGTVVGDMDLQFLHEGLPKLELQAEWKASNASVHSAAPAKTVQPQSSTREADEFVSQLKRKLSHPTIASKHWLIRQYDHEVQARSVIKPLVGPGEGPSDAAVIRPRLDSDKCIAIGCGLAPQLSDLDPYWMAVASIDEAIRNVVCAGGDPRKTAILDNFCWPSAQDSQSLGALVRACQACYDVSKAYGVPFISGKDSLNNVFAMNDAGDAAMIMETVHKRYPEFANALANQRLNETRRLSIPYTLLISAISLIEDWRQCITSVPVFQKHELANPKQPFTTLFFVGTSTTTWNDTRLDQMAALHTTVAELIRDKKIVAAHDCSDGGMAVAIAEMAIAGNLECAYFMRGAGVLANPFFEPASGYIIQPANPKALNSLSKPDGVVVDLVAIVRQSAAPQFSSYDIADAARIWTHPAQSSLPLSELRQSWMSPLDW